VSQLVTGEAVVLDLRTAGVPSRVLATLLDAMVQLVGFFLLTFLVGVAATGSSDAVVAGLSVVVLVLVAVGYPVLMETLLRGRTLGKMALGLRVVRDDGGPIGFRQAITRALLGLFVEKPGITFYAAGLITSLANERSKRLGDLVAGTVVVQERVAAPRQDLVAMPPPLAGWATTLDLSGLRDDLAESARSYLGRWSSLTPSAQDDLGQRIAGAVAAVVTPPPPQGVPPWAYLSAVLAERRRRSGYGGVPGYGGMPGYGAPPGYAVPPVPPAPAAPAPAAAPEAAAPTPPEPGPSSPFAPPG
jgi:uncharacterized RDD family membrane protein YckC